MSARALQSEPPDLSDFDPLLPYSAARRTLNTREAAKCFERSVDFVYSMIGEGRLEAEAPQNRKTKRYVITRRSVLLLMAEQSTVHPRLFMERLVRLLDVLTGPQLAILIEQAKKRRARHS